MKKIGNWIGVIMLVSLLVALMAAPSPANASGTIAYVVPGGFITGSCSSWASACDLQHALNVAASGYELWVKAGTYRPTSIADRTASFVLENGVAIYGGFAGTETKRSQRNPKTHITVLSGEIGGVGITDNSYHVVYSTAVGSTAVLDGFTIMAGNANGSSPNYWGGGMLNYAGSSPTLSNLIFSGNSAIAGGGMFNITNSSPKLTNVTFNTNSASFGGGMYNYSSSPALTNVTFNGNSGTNDGGGMYNTSSSSPTLTDVTFHGNSANQGGGIYDDTSCNPILTNVTFSNNPATDSGGGMYDNGSSPTLTNVTFSGNSATTDGGGMFNLSSSNLALVNVTYHGNSARSGGGMFNRYGTPTLTNVTFLGNPAITDGGGMFNQGSSPTLTNVTFTANSAPHGGGMDNYSYSTPVLKNVTFSGNSATTDGGGMYNLSNSSPIIYDGIFWNDGTEITNAISSSGTITDSLIAGGCPSGVTCTGTLLTTNPRLSPLANNGGFTQTMALALGGPAIDAGNNATCASKDQRGVKRPQGPHCDMGAYEAPVTKTYSSSGSQDGWILESGENTNVGGGSPNSSGSTLTLGDDSSRRQYRTVLSFSTASLPDNASISTVSLKLKRSSVTPSSTNPIVLLQGIMLDLKKGFFGSSSALQTSDFQASASKTVGPYSPALSSGFYSINLPASSFTSINKVNTNSGLTQIRLRFKLDDNNNSIANTLNLISGNNLTPSNRPELIIVFYTP